MSMRTTTLKVSVVLAMAIMLALAGVAAIGRAYADSPRDNASSLQAVGADASLTAQGDAAQPDGKAAASSRPVRLKNGAYAITLQKNGSVGLAVSGSRLKRASSRTAGIAGRFYVRNEKGGITLQSVDTGKFVYANKSSVKMRTWTSSCKSRNVVWKLSRASDGGIRLKNAATRRSLTLTRPTATVSAKGTGFRFRATRLVHNGTYKFENVAQGKVLDVWCFSFDMGANLQLWDSTGGGNQVFTVKAAGGGFYEITNIMSRMCVDVENGSAEQGANVRQWERNRAAAQRWRPGITRSGALYFTNAASGKVLAAQGGGLNANVVSEEFRGVAKTQLWRLVPTTWYFTGDIGRDRYIMGIVGECRGDLARCFDWMGNLDHVQSVDDRILPYGIVDDDVSLSYVDVAWRDGVADCYTDAAMFCWLARGCGYDANMRAGGCPSASGGVVPHGWTEVYIDGETYVCDANLKRDLPGYNWYMNTYASAPVEYSL